MSYYLYSPRFIKTIGKTALLARTVLVENGKATKWSSAFYKKSTQESDRGKYHYRVKVTPK